jgi:signal transduction histidine kinase
VGGPGSWEVLFTQLPFVVAVASLAVFVAIADSATFLLLWFITGLALTALATLLALIILWRAVDPRWLILTPVVDLVAIAFFREADYTEFPSISILVVFPVVWLAYAFSYRALILAMVAAFVIFLFPFIRVGEWPTTRNGWAAVTLVPLAICLIANSMWIAANTLRRSQRRLAATSVQLQTALSTAEDDKISLDTVINTVDAVITLYDQNGVPVLWNNAARQMGEKSGGVSPTGTRAVPLVYAADRTTVLPIERQIAARALRGEVLVGEVFWIGALDNQSAMIAASREARRADGVLLGTVIVAHDVTSLVEAIGVRDEFLSTISHELITPMTSIIGYLELVQSQEIDVAVGIEVIQRNADRLRSVISDLVDVAGAPAIDRHPIDLAIVVRASVEKCRPAAKLVGIDLTVTAAVAIANVDRLAIGQVLDNLLSNAVKFTNVFGSIEVTLDSDSRSARISVTDNGIGISAEDQRQIFDRFFRARTSRVNAIAGAGLGMAIVRSIVDAHDGTIDVDSAVGEGTTVTVRLPLHLLAPRAA